MRVHRPTKVPSLFGPGILGTHQCNFLYHTDHGKWIISKVQFEENKKRDLFFHNEKFKNHCHWIYVIFLIIIILEP